MFEVTSRRRDRIAGSWPFGQWNRCGSGMFSIKHVGLNKSDSHRVTVVSALREGSNEWTQLNNDQHGKR